MAPELRLTTALAAMFLTSARIPGMDDMLVTGGYYDLAFRREPGGWKIERLVEDNRWMRRPAPVDLGRGNG